MPRRPLDGTPSITQVWGEPSSIYRLGYHTGVDYGVGNNTAVLSPANGTVKQVADGRASSDGRGFFMKIQGDDGVEHNLYHLARWHIGAGSRVAEGQHVADSDNTGLSSGPHLHWETRRTPYELTNNFNPADWLYAPTPTPPPSSGLQANQRVLENKSGVNQRAEPNTNAQIIKDWPYDTEPFSFKAFVHGERVNGNDVWYVGQYSGGYFWSGAFIDKSTNGLPDQTPSPTPVPPTDPAPVPPAVDMPVAFPPDDASVIAVYPSPDVDEYATQTPKFIVIHHWGAKDAKISLQSVINTMTADNGLSIHYIVDDSGVYQVVPENKRAQHAGPQGNDGIGIECDPNGGDAMYAHLRLLVANIRVRWDKLALTKHSDYMATLCPAHIDLLRIEPITVPPVVPPTDDWGKQNNELLKSILAIVQWIKDKLGGIFK